MTTQSPDSALSEREEQRRQALSKAAAWEEARALIARAWEERWPRLDLTGLIDDDIPEQLYALFWLEELVLSRAGSLPPASLRAARPFDLPPQIGRLAHLRSLDLRGLRLRSLEAVAALHELEQLACAWTEVTSLEPLWDLHLLERLDCCNSNVASLEPLRGMGFLERLDCSWTKVTSLEPIRGATFLNTLSCAWTKVDSLEPLRGLAFLREVNCGSSLVSSLDPVGGMGSLSSLDCSWTRVTTLEPLRTATSLRALFCRSTLVLSLEPLAGLDTLEVLDCSGTPIGSLDHLRGLPRLATLRCSGTKVGDLAPLAGKTSLRTLFCRSTAVSSLEPLRSVTGLEALFCRRTPVDSLEPLRELGALQRVDCSGTRITSLEPLWESLMEGTLAHLDVRQCAIPDLPQGVLNQEDCADVLQAYLIDSERGAWAGRRVKVILLGNSGAGKTILAHWLVHGEPPSDQPAATHGVVMTETTLGVPGEDGPLKVELWDFGGQTAFQSAHQALLRGQRAVFVLVSARNSGGHGEPGYSVTYWRRLIETLAPGNPVLLVKNQPERLGGADPAGTWAEQYVAREVVDVATGQNVWALRLKLQDAVRQLRDVWNAPLPAPWFEVARALGDQQRESLSGDRPAEDPLAGRIMPWTDFEALVAVHAVCDPELVLQYLENLGLCFHSDGLFGNHVVLDLGWLVDALYRLFDPKRRARHEIAECAGVFSGRDVPRYLADPSGWLPAGRETGLTLDFLLQAEVVYELTPPGLPLGDRRFLVPGLLPSGASPQRPRAFGLREQWARPNAGQWTARSEYLSLPRFQVERLLGRFAQRLGGDVSLWYDGLAYTDSEAQSEVLVYCLCDIDEAAGIIDVRAWRGDQALALARFLRFTSDVGLPQPVSRRFSADGEVFVEEGALERAFSDGREQVVAQRLGSTQSVVLDRQPFDIFCDDEGLSGIESGPVPPEGLDSGWQGSSGFVRRDQVDGEDRAQAGARR